MSEIELGTGRLLESERYSIFNDGWLVGLVEVGDHEGEGPALSLFLFILAPARQSRIESVI